VSVIVLEASSGGVRARADVEAPLDSLTSLVDRIAARLLEADSSGRESSAHTPSSCRTSPVTK
jgi:hypothetical protein